MTRKEQILKIFPKELRTVLSQISVDFEQIQEIRLRAGRPLVIVSRNREYLMDAKGNLTDGRAERKDGTQTGFLTVSQRQMKETVEFMGSFSLYAAEEELKQGFLTIQGGHRIGVAGKIVAHGNDIKLMKFISFINVRVAHQIRGCADGVMDDLYTDEGRFRNTLIVSPPCCGKTTLLRDVIRQASDGYMSVSRNKWMPGRTVGVVDERSELGACYQGEPQNDLGMRTDILDCCPKSQGMMMLVRSMAPAIVAVDEIGGKEDVEAVEYVRNCGCSLAATVHGEGLKELEQKPFLGRLIKEGTFERLIFLEGGRGPGRIRSIWDGAGNRIQTGKETDISR